MGRDILPDELEELGVRLKSELGIDQLLPNPDIEISLAKLRLAERQRLARLANGRPN